MAKLIIVGRTNNQDVFVASNERALILDEYLVIDDCERNYPVGEIISTFAYPTVDKDTFLNEYGMYQSLKSVGINLDSIVYIGKLHILEELQTPIMIGALVSEPNYEQIEEILMGKTPEEGMVLGVIKGTENLQGTIPDKVKNIAPLFDSKKGIIPQIGIPFIFDHYSFKEYPGMGCFGGSGSGKTFAMRVICEEIMQKGIPGIVLDPHYELVFTEEMIGLPKENNYNYKNKHEVFQIGVNIGISFTDISTDELLSLMEYIAEISPAMRGALEALHERNDTYASLSTKIKKLKQAFENEEKSNPRDREDIPEDVALIYLKYKNSVSGSVTLQAVLWRLDQLYKTGIFNCDISGIETCILKRKLAVIRGRTFMVRMIASYLINKLYSKRRNYKDWEQKNRYSEDRLSKPPVFPPFFIILDEAHNFAPDGNFSTPIKSTLREISQEARKYGVFLVLGTQRPMLLDSTIIAQLNTKIIFRTSIEPDIERIKKETSLNEEQLNRLPSLNSGNAFISSATFKKTLYVRFRTTKTKSPHSLHPFDELDCFDIDKKAKDVLISYLPIDSSNIVMKHSKINSDVGKHNTADRLLEILEELYENGEIEKEKSAFGARYRKKD